MITEIFNQNKEFEEKALAAKKYNHGTSQLPLRMQLLKKSISEKSIEFWNCKNDV